MSRFPERERARQLTTKNAMDWLTALSSHGLDGNPKNGVFIRNVADIAADTLRAKDGALASATAETERLRGVLWRIQSNARSWHGPPPDDSGHVRALAVIAEWCDEALAVPQADTNPDANRDPEEGVDGP